MEILSLIRDVRINSALVDARISLAMEDPAVAASGLLQRWSDGGREYYLRLFGVASIVLRAQALIDAGEPAGAINEVVDRQIAPLADDAIFELVRVLRSPLREHAALH